MQTLTITIEFQTEHKPGTEEHLRVIAETELERKGVVIKDGVIVM